MHYVWLVKDTDKFFAHPGPTSPSDRHLVDLELTYQEWYGLFFEALKAESATGKRSTPWGAIGPIETDGAIPD